MSENQKKWDEYRIKAIPEIAQQLAKNGSESGIIDEDHVEEITKALLMVWNARGAADLKTLESEGVLAAVTDVIDAIKALDA